MQENVLKLCRCRQIPVQENKILLKSVDKSLSLAAENIGKIVGCLLPTLNGTCTREEILSQMPAEFKEGAAELLQLFEKEGFLSSEEAATRATLAQRRIVLAGYGRLSSKIAANLRDSGMEHITEIDSSQADTWPLLQQLRKADMAVVCTDMPRPDLCDLINKAALTANLPWLLVQADGRDGWLGPLFIPQETGCYTCLTKRLLADSFHPETDKAVLACAMKEPFKESLEFLPPFIDMLAAMAALEIIRHLTALSPPLTYKAQIIIDCVTGISRRDVLHRLPRCPSCSAAGEQISAIQPFSG
jgi:ribosomal protein S12 methylthiotransferase accessory factor